MRILLDTHTLLWYAAASPQLSLSARQAIDSPFTRSVVSVASLWELSIKVGLGKLDLGEAVDAFWRRHIENGVEVLPISSPEAIAVGALPLHHRDPFDRILIAQSLVYDLPIVTLDPLFDQYGVNRIW